MHGEPREAGVDIAGYGVGDPAAFGARLDQLYGKAGLAAYESIRGAGQITEKETAMATDAMTRIRNYRQGTKEWDAALDDYEYAIEAGTKKIRDLAKRKPSADGGAPQPTVSNW